MSVGVPPRIETDVSLTANIRERIFRQLLTQMAIFVTNAASKAARSPLKTQPTTNSFHTFAHFLQ